MTPAPGRYPSALGERGAVRWLVLAAAMLVAATIAATAVVGLVMLIWPRIGGHDVASRLLGSTIITVVYSMMILGAALIIRQRRFVAGSLFTLPLSVAAAVLWLVLVWNDSIHWETEDLVGFSALSFSLLILALLHTGAMICLPTRSSTCFFGKLTVSIGFSGSVLTGVAMIWWFLLFGDPQRRPPPPAFDVLGPLAMLIGFASLVATSFVAMWIRHTNRQWEKARDSVSQKMTLDLECPKCGAAQALRPGTANCASCGVLMQIELEEPRCECGYLLYRLASPTCPECGRKVPEQARAREESNQSAPRPTP